MLSGKEAKEKLRRERDRTSFEKKVLEMLKIKLQKKRGIARAAKQVVNFVYHACLCNNNSTTCAAHCWTPCEQNPTLSW